MAAFQKFMLEDNEGNMAVNQHQLKLIYMWSSKCLMIENLYSEAPTRFCCGYNCSLRTRLIGSSRSPNPNARLAWVGKQVNVLYTFGPFMWWKWNICCWICSIVPSLFQCHYSVIRAFCEPISCKCSLVKHATVSKGLKCSTLIQ